MRSARVRAGPQTRLRRLQGWQMMSPMSAVMITGGSGAGKTTIAAVLARRGLASIDADDDPSLSRFVDPADAVVEPPAAPDFAWIARHSWEWNPARLDELIRAAAPATLYVCGHAANELQLADRFTHVILLEIDEPTMLARLDAPSRDNDWGRIGDTRESERRWLPGYQDRMRAFGAIPVDATQPLDRVVDAILSHTLASSTTSRASKPSNQPGSPARP
jgi:broad-specificity NMP kinase